MSPKSNEQFKLIREEKKSLIKQKALELFAREGYDKTSISKIAKEAGISKGLLYNYFDSKEDLLTAIIFKEMEKIVSFFDPNHDGVLEMQEMKYFIQKTFELIKQNPEFWRLYFMLAFQPQVMKLVEHRFWEVIRPMMQVSNEFFSNKGYKEPIVWTRFLAAVLDGISLHYILDTDNFPMEKIEEIIINIICYSNPEPQKNQSQ
jgi:AcrR family transcriptional regulator